MSFSTLVQRHARIHLLGDTRHVLGFFNNSVRSMRRLPVVVMQLLNKTAAVRHDLMMLRHKERGGELNSPTMSPGEVLIRSL